MKLHANDLVKAGCNDCEGLFCCRGMGKQHRTGSAGHVPALSGASHAPEEVLCSGAGTARGGRSDPAQPENGGSEEACLF